METITDKYNRIRPLIKDGDLILFHGTRLLAKIIQHCDKAYYNHIGIVMEMHGGLFILDSQASGVVSDRLSKRISDYKKGEFCVIHSKTEIADAELDKLISGQDLTAPLYDYANGTRELLNRKFGWNIKLKPSKDRDICSDFVYEYALRNNFIEPFKNRVAFPEDYIRHRNISETLLIGEFPR